MKIIWNFLGGSGGAKQKPVGAVWIFSGTAHSQFRLEFKEMQNKSRSLSKKAASHDISKMGCIEVLASG